MIKDILHYAGQYRASGIKSMTGMEGSGWSADIYREGVKVGSAVDYGDGGPVRIDMDNAQELQLLKEHALPLAQFDFEQAEEFLDNLVNYELALKKLKTLCKKKVLAVLEPEKDDYGVQSTYNSFNCEDNEKNRELILKKYPQALILNAEVDLIDFKKVKPKKKM